MFVGFLLMRNLSLETFAKPYFQKYNINQNDELVTKKRTFAKVSLRLFT
ncbi:hypothetical protein SAMN05428952_102636 [Nitrosomonas sp. Nm132]|nr:hypothetical protein SAMN05428952_102636 [Nitrosomonas sp. Nm132]